MRLGVVVRLCSPASLLPSDQPAVVGERRQTGANTALGVNITAEEEENDEDEKGYDDNVADC